MRTETFGPSAILTPANGVTLARIAFAPVAFALMLTDHNRSSWLLVAVWFVLSFSDMLDGRLARKYGSTRSGAFLDPLADKILVLGGVGCMCLGGRFWFGWLARRCSSKLRAPSWCLCQCMPVVLLLYFCKR